MSDMARLTKRDRKGRAYFDDDGAMIRGANGTFRQKKDMTSQFIHQRFVALDKTIDRLAAYEDTGLEPNDVTDLMAAHGTAILKLSEYRMQQAKCLPPPNNPLTLDELRELDGEPVWLRCDTPDGKLGYWCLCENGIIVMPSGLTMDCRDVPHWELYRYKPEDLAHD